MVIAYSPKDCINVDIPDPPSLPSGWNILYDFYSERYMFITPTGKYQQEPPNINEKNRTLFQTLLIVVLNILKSF